MHQLITPDGARLCDPALLEAFLAHDAANPGVGEFVVLVMAKQAIHAVLGCREIRC